MSTRTVVETYFKRLERKTGWEPLLADTSERHSSSTSTSASGRNTSV